MPIPTPVHVRTAPLCRSLAWKDWGGYAAVCRYDSCAELEYHAIRQAAGLLDVSPLVKVEIAGPDAARLLARMVTRDISRLGVGRVTYTPWTDDRGKILDDGTVARLDETRFRLTAASPAFRWVSRLGRGLDADVTDTTATTAALALQGPRSRDVLVDAAGPELADLRFFHIARATIDGVDVEVSRTGYTGDLGYEVWVDAASAVRVWDALFDAGRRHGLVPLGLDALDVSRIEAGFILHGVDYFAANHVVRDTLRSTPLEVGLGWALDLREDRAPFVGRDAILAEKARGPAWSLVGLELDWAELEALYEDLDLPPALAPVASRVPIPIYAVGGRQVGQATSHTWSPHLKKAIALASVRTEHAATGSTLRVEHTPMYERRTVRARVVETPFFDPPRKRANIERVATV